MTDSLSRLNLPGAVLGPNGRALSVNALLERLDKQFIPAAGGRLVLSHQPAQQLFKSALENSTHSGATLTNFSIPVPAIDDSPACVVHLLPVRRQARDIFSGADILLAATSLTHPEAPPAHVLHGLFDLSSAEARVAGSLIEGNTVEDIAQASGLSRETIRAHLKSVLAKTGTKRQAELVGLLSGVQTGRG